MQARFQMGEKKNIYFLKEFAFYYGNPSNSMTISKTEILMKLTHSEKNAKM